MNVERTKFNELVVHNPLMGRNVIGDIAGKINKYIKKIIEQYYLYIPQDKFNYLISNLKDNEHQCRYALGCKKDQIGYSDSQEGYKIYCNCCYICDKKLLTKEEESNVNDKLKSECEHVLPVFSGAAFIGLVDCEHRENFNESSKNNYGWVHNSCNSVKTAFKVDPSILTDIWAILKRPNIDECEWSYDHGKAEKLYNKARNEIMIYNKKLENCIPDCDTGEFERSLLIKKLDKVVEVLNNAPSHVYNGNFIDKFLEEQLNGNCISKLSESLPSSSTTPYQNCKSILEKYIIGLLQLTLYHKYPSNNSPNKKQKTSGDNKQKKDLYDTCFNIIVQRTFNKGIYDCYSYDSSGIIVNLNFNNNTEDGPSSSSGSQFGLNLSKNKNKISKNKISDEEADKAFAELCKTPKIFMDMAKGDEKLALIIANHVSEKVNEQIILLLKKQNKKQTKNQKITYPVIKRIQSDIRFLKN